MKQPGLLAIGGPEALAGYSAVTVWVIFLVKGIIARVYFGHAPAAAKNL